MLGVEVFRRGASLRRTSPNCTSMRVREQFGRRVGVSAFFSQLVLVWMLLCSSGSSKYSCSYLQYFTWYSRCQQCLQLSEISSLTRGFVALYSYRVLQFATAYQTQLDYSSNQQWRRGVQARGYPSLPYIPRFVRGRPQVVTTLLVLRNPPCSDIVQSC